MLAGLNLAKTIPVGNSDAGSYFNTEVLSAVDYGVCVTSSGVLDRTHYIVSFQMFMPGLPTRPFKMRLDG